MYRYLVLVCVLFVCCNSNSNGFEDDPKQLRFDAKHYSLGWQKPRLTIMYDNEYRKEYIVIHDVTGVAVTPRLK
jgi:hypothetical protein